VTVAERKDFARFDVKKDCALFTRKGEAWTLAPGEFAIFFPGAGAHAPGLSDDGARTIRKVVVKVRY
jgi:beta-galactosidase beta subunit